MKEHEEKVLNREEEAKFMAVETGFSEDVVQSWLDAEETYLMEHGIIMMPGVNCTEEELQEQIDNPDPGFMDLDCDDMVDYIAEAAGLSKEAAYALLDAEYLFEYRTGIAGEMMTV